MIQVKILPLHDLRTIDCCAVIIDLDVGLSSWVIFSTATLTFINSNMAPAANSLCLQAMSKQTHLALQQQHLCPLDLLRGGSVALRVEKAAAVRLFHND